MAGHSLKEMDSPWRGVTSKESLTHQLIRLRRNPGTRTRAPVPTLLKRTGWPWVGSRRISLSLGGSREAPWVSN